MRLARDQADKAAGRAARRGAGPAAHQQPHRPRPAAPAPRQVDLRLVGPGDADPRGGPDHAARLQVGARRISPGCAPRAGRRRSTGTCATAASSSASAAASRCSGRRIHDPLGLEGAPGSTRGARPARLRDDPGGGQATDQRQRPARLRATPRSPATRSTPGVSRDPPWRGRRSIWQKARMAPSAPTARSWAPICTASSSPRPPATPCSPGPDWTAPRPATMPPCARRPSSAWPTWWRATWIPPR